MLPLNLLALSIVSLAFPFYSATASAIAGSHDVRRSRSTFSSTNSENVSPSDHSSAAVFHDIETVDQNNITIKVNCKRAATWTYIGCTSDSSSRALTGYQVNINANTPQKCQAVCEDKGFLYAGVQNGAQCFCGNALYNGQGVTVAESQCSFTCAGDAKQKCGAGYRNSLYKSNAAPLATWTWVGCTTDSAKRALTGYSGSNSQMTPQKCQELCADQKFALAGLQRTSAEYVDGGQCYCGNSLMNGQGQVVDNSQCQTTCLGNSAAKCGGSYKNGRASNAVSTSSSSMKPSTSSTTSRSSTTVATSTSRSATVTTTSRPATTTTTSRPATTTTSRPATTSTSASAAITTPTGTPTRQNSRRLGCFQEPSGGRMLNSANYDFLNNTPDRCWQYCFGRGWLFAGVQNGISCYCGNTIDWAAKRPDSECRTACGGDSTLSCGGTARNEVYTQSTNIEVGAPAPASGGRKYLWAHHMVGNTYSYTQSIWASDIQQAAAAGIDGFALNMGRDDWQPARVAQAYAAAQAFGSSFKLFFSLDMTSFSCSSASQATSLASLVAQYAKHPNQVTYQNKLFLTFFDGAYCTFGQGNVNAGWAFFRSQLAARNVTAYIMPSIFTGTNTFASSQNWFDGHFSWDNTWPMGGSDLDGSLDLSERSLLQGQGKGYMPGISPCFFTYYAPNSYNKNWIYRSDDWLLATRLEQMIRQRNLYDQAEIITWNDYGESHYIGPIRADQPMSQGWTDGMPHTGWLNLIKFYAQAFKTGSYPSNSDQIYVWSRPHPKSGTPSAPSMARPRNADYTDDNLYGVVILASTADVVLSNGANVATYKNLPPGVNKISVASNEGAIGAQIVRGGKAVKSYSSSGSFAWSRTFKDWNFNYFVGSA